MHPAKQHDGWTTGTKDLLSVQELSQLDNIYIHGSDESGQCRLCDFSFCLAIIHIRVKLCCIHYHVAGGVDSFQADGPFATARVNYAILIILFNLNLVAVHRNIHSLPFGRRCGQISG
jgi:hypothetical protein